MPAYGYRMFVVELREGRGRKAVDFAKCGDENYAVVLERLLGSLLGNVKVGTPRRAIEDVDETLEAAAPVDDDDEDGPLEKGWLVTHHERHGNTVYARVRYGIFGDHDQALARSGDDHADLKDKAPSREYRIALALPRSGLQGIMAVEDVGRSCPLDPTIKWLSQASKDEASPGWRLSWRPMMDSQQLRRLLEQGRLDKIELVKYAVGQDRSRNQRELVLTAPRLEGQWLQDVSSKVLDWGRRYQQRRAGESDEQLPSDREAAQQLAAVLGQNVAGMDFDDGYVVVSQVAGGKKNISPSRVDQ